MSTVSSCGFMDLGKSNGDLFKRAENGHLGVSFLEGAPSLAAFKRNEMKTAIVMIMIMVMIMVINMVVLLLLLLL